ncbi:hypothetical protein MESS4_800026 [Mesorhizobium sp. STM 4661]|nr:hypothetical protein MESS4_800026 [Mesorhizobium sp. STM 4661]
MTETPVLELSGISKRFGDIVANENISISLARGEILALLGENGAGKTTLMSILFGHYRADSGGVLIDGWNCLRANPGRRSGPASAWCTSIFRWRQI